MFHAAIVHDCAFGVFLEKRPIPLRLAWPPVRWEDQRVVRAWSRFGLHSGVPMQLDLDHGKSMEELRVRTRFCFYLWAISTIPDRYLTR